MKAVIIDNYDSFTYNLYHLIRETGTDTTVLRNDAFDLKNIEAYDKIILSPGPGIPEEAGLLLDVIRTYAGRKPILGVCLGHQAIGQAFGAQLVNLSDVFHGVQTPCFQTEKDYIFQGKEYYVFVIPVDQNLDLKKAAKAAGEKNVEMIHVKDINKVTGYIRGGCSPVGMKKLYGTFVNETAQNLDTIIVSAGKIGYQIELKPADLQEVTNFEYADVIH